MPRIIMNHAFIARWTRTPHSIGRLSASASSHHSLSSAAFIINIAESDFRHAQALSTPDRAWQDLLQRFEAARDEWSAMEAVVHLELVLEAGGLLIEEGTAFGPRSGQGRSRAA